MHIHRITAPDDPVIERAIKLYQRLFPDNGLNYTTAELAEFASRMDTWSIGRHVVTEHILLTAHASDSDCQPAGLGSARVPRADMARPAPCTTALAGFLLCHYYPGRRKALISYLGVDDTLPETRNHAAEHMFACLREYLHGERECDQVFYETLKPEPALPEHENRTRRARIRLFKQRAGRAGLSAVELGFDYISPRISLAQHAAEHALALVVIFPKRTLAPPPGGHFSRRQVADFLRFLYHDCYGEVYEKHDARFNLFQSYLRACLDKATSLLPDTIPAS